MASRLLGFRHLVRRSCSNVVPQSAQVVSQGAEGLGAELGGLSRAFAKKHFAELLQPEVQERLRPLFTTLTNYGVDEKRVKSLVRDNVATLRGSFNLQDNIDFLRRHCLTDSDIAQTVKKQPNILVVSVPNVLEAKLKFFIEQGFSSAAITALLSSSPSTFTSCNVQKELIPRIAFLARSGINRSHLSACIVKFPPLLTYDVDTKLKPLVKCLSRSLHDSTTAKVLVHAPAILGLDLETVSELLNAFKYIGYKGNDAIWAQSLEWGCRHGVEAVRDKIDFLMSMDIPYKSAVLILKAEPHVYKVDNPVLKEKLDFFFKEMKFDVRQLERVPTYLSRKLMDRVRIRWQVMSLLKNKGIIKNIYMQDLVTLPKKWFVETFVFKYPDCGRIYYGGRSAVKQARIQARLSGGGGGGGLIRDDTSGSDSSE